MASLKELGRAPGWDSKKRRRVARNYGSLRAAAEHHGVDVSDIPQQGRRTAMKVWSRLVRHFGGTDGIPEAP